jgi:hypothetical protein
MLTLNSVAILVRSLLTPPFILHRVIFVADAESRTLLLLFFVYTLVDFVLALTGLVMAEQKKTPTSVVLIWCVLAFWRTWAWNGLKFPIATAIGVFLPAALIALVAIVRLQSGNGGHSAA